MFEKLRANVMFWMLLKRPNIDKAYAMVKPEDSWYDTITKVHNALAEIRQLPHEVVEITAHDQARLKGIYYTRPEGSDVTVICIHGYTSHAEREWAFPGLFYLSLGYNVLIPYQRAHGLSEGKYIAMGALEQHDIQGWVRKINEMTPGGRIIIHGLSMGGGIALVLSKQQMQNVRGIISDAPSTSVRDLFEMVSKEVAKKNTEQIAAYAIQRFEKEFGVDIDDLECVDVVASSRYPILLSAGSMEKCQELFERIKNANPQQTQTVILPGCNHGNGMYKQTQLYQNAIKEFINSVL